jgi:DNA-directed RNA polymerase specialized sigma24 family protein
VGRPSALDSGASARENVGVSDEGIARLLAAALAADGAGAEALTNDGVSRADRLIAVIDQLRSASTLDHDIAPPEVSVRFADDDRWAGWRFDTPTVHPDDPGPDRSAVLRTLRRLPLAMRTLLILRDSAGLEVADCARAADIPETAVVTLLDQARAAFVAALDYELERKPA